MANEHDRFLSALNAEKLQAQERRGSLISHKLGWVTGLFAVGAVELPMEIKSSIVLYFVPVISLVYDLYILGENYGIKRMGCFVRKSLDGALESEWETFVGTRRDRFSWYALPLSTVITFLACALVLEQSSDRLSLMIWSSSFVVLMAIIYSLAHFKLKGLNDHKSP